MKIAKVKIQIKSLENLLKGNWFIAGSKVPQDFEALYIITTEFLENNTDHIWVVGTSHLFDEVEEDELIPEYNPEIRFYNYRDNKEFNPVDIYDGVSL